MKKAVFLTALLALTLSVSSCGKKNDKAQTPNQSQNQSQSVNDISGNYAEGSSENVDMKKIDGEELKAENDDNDSAKLEASEISIEDAKLVDVDEKKYVIVSYKFTNKTNSDESFSSLMDAAVFQDGSQLSKAAGNFEIEGFDSNSTAERIGSGKTVTAQEIYNIENDAPIEVIVKEFNSQNNMSVSKTFKVK